MHLACNLLQVERGCHHGVLMVDGHLLQLPVQHVGANREREAEGADILILFWVFNLYLFMLCYLNCCIVV